MTSLGIRKPSVGLKLKRNSEPLDLVGEEWRTITEFPSYQVSTFGRVRRIGAGVRTLGKHKAGYLLAVMSVGGKPFVRYVHRLVALTFIPNPNGFPVVNHIDADPSNSRVSNLEWTTQKENIRLAMVIRGNWLKNSDRSKRKTPIIRIDEPSGEERCFESIREACDEINRAIVANRGIAKNPQLFAGNICHARDRPKLAYGFFWVSPRKRLALAIIRERFKNRADTRNPGQPQRQAPDPSQS